MVAERIVIALASRAGALSSGRDCQYARAQPTDHDHEKRLRAVEHKQWWLSGVAQALASLPRTSALASRYGGTSRQLRWYRLLNQMAEVPWNKPTPHKWRLFHSEGENHEDGSCCCHYCNGDRSPRSGEGEAVAIGAPARLSVVGA